MTQNTRKSKSLTDNNIIVYTYKKNIVYVYVLYVCLFCHTHLITQQTTTSWYFTYRYREVCKYTQRRYKLTIRIQSLEGVRIILRQLAVHKHIQVSINILITSQIQVSVNILITPLIQVSINILITSLILLQRTLLMKILTDRINLSYH